MKILDIPQNGKCGVFVSYKSPFGQVRRQLVVPKNTPSQARERARRDFGRWAHAWAAMLTEEQRAAWNLAGPKVQSATRLGQSGPLSGQQHFQGINSARSCIGRPALLLPPEPVVFDPSPVGQLSITNDRDGVSLLLPVSGPVTGDIMVFAQAPCSRGRSKRRNVCYIGLLPAPVNGVSNIAPLYIARFGVPAPQQKVFVVTIQQQNGWESHEHLTSAVVPDPPERPDPPATNHPEVQPTAAPQPLPAPQAAADSALSLMPQMHKGCTPAAQGLPTGQVVAPVQGSKDIDPACGAGSTEPGEEKRGQ